MRKPADRFWSYDGESFAWHASATAARTAAGEALDYFRTEAAEGWPDFITSVAWGEVREQATEVNRVEHDPDCTQGEDDASLDCPVPEGVDYICDYKLVPVDPWISTGPNRDENWPAPKILVLCWFGGTTPTGAKFASADQGTRAVGFVEPGPLQSGWMVLGPEGLYNATRPTHWTPLTPPPAPGTGVTL